MVKCFTILERSSEVGTLVNLKFLQMLIGLTNQSSAKTFEASVKMHTVVEQNMSNEF